ncbi:MAG: hypothetical protein V4850_26215 [Myxococcota bacterium]
MITLLLAALLAPASAAVTFTRTPHEDEKDSLEPAPVTTVKSETKEWRLKAQRRGVYAAIDAAVRWREAPIDACVRAAGATTPVTAQVDVALLEDGRSTVKAGPGADAGLAGCIATALGDQQLPVPLYTGVRLTYTATWDPAPVVVPPPFVPPAAPVAEVDPGAPVAPPTPPEDPKRDAFAPAVDVELGFGPIPWGGRAADHEGMYASSTQLGTTLYTRQADTAARWMGATTSLVSYGFGPDGLYAVRIASSGSTTAWKLREALAARYGPSKWDVRFGAYYWRGESVVLQLQPVPNSEVVVVTLLDIARARASGLADRLPGDRDDPTGTTSNRRMPRIFKD